MGTNRSKRTLGGVRRRTIGGVAAAAMLASLLPATAAAAQEADDPREGLGGGFQDAEEAASNMELLAHLEKPDGFIDPDNPGSFAFANSDMAFGGDFAFAGNYAGVQIYDISDPEAPELAVGVLCPGGQGDVSVNGDLMFISVQQFGTTDCTELDEGDDEFVGVRVFDISNIENPTQVAAVETCRGSHTHTVVEDPNDDGNVYVYVNGTSGVRDDAPESIEGGCVVGPMEDAPTEEDPDRQVPSRNPDDFPPGTETDRYQIEVIQVPVEAPENAEIVAEPRLFADDESLIGLDPGTDSCHDITAYPEIGIAAGACEGNGLLIDITDPEDPERIDFVTDDENFAYWHSATFNNDGTKVVFTDELGGGVGAECTPDTPETFGANAIFDITGEGTDREMEFVSYFKPLDNQTETENCVAHNGNLIPVPGRDLMVQAWYQGGITVMDFTDSENPEEIAFFDRGPFDEEELVLAGYWSAYYYNGNIFGTEIARGFDSFALTESEFLSANDLAAASSVQLDEHTAQSQTMVTNADRISACASIAPRSFPDFSGEGPHGDSVPCIGGFGISEGWPDGTFRPSLDIDRDQMASFIARMLTTAGVELPDSPEDAFDDDDGNTHELAINQLTELGVIEGKSDTEYAPDDSVTRGQMASLIVRASEDVLGEELPSPSAPFTDVPDGYVHADAIDAAFAAGIVEGRTATTYEPQREVRRDQMASFIARSIEVLFDEGVQLLPGQ